MIQTAYDHTESQDSSRFGVGITLYAFRSGRQCPATSLLSALSSACFTADLHPHPALVPECGTCSLHCFDAALVCVDISSHTSSCLRPSSMLSALLPGLHEFLVASDRSASPCSWLSQDCFLLCLLGCLIAVRHAHCCPACPQGPCKSYI